MQFQAFGLSEVIGYIHQFNTGPPVYPMAGPTYVGATVTFISLAVLMGQWNFVMSFMYVG